MSAPINAILTGQFVSTGNVQNITIPSQYQDFEKGSAKHCPNQ